jgi:hypothetical protein
MNGIKIFAAAILTATTVLAGCDRASSPVEPEPIPAVAPEFSLTILEALLVGHEQHDLSFVAIVPAAGDSIGADSLLVTTTDLLNGTTSTLSASRLQPGGALFSTTSTSSSGTIQDGEKVDATGKVVTKTEKVTYSDGSTGYHTETTTSDFVMTGRKSGAQCRSNETFVFQGDNPGGATTFTQVVQSVTVCEGDGREFLLHINLHFTVTPTGKVASNVANIKVKGSSGS